MVCGALSLLLSWSCSSRHPEPSGVDGIFAPADLAPSTSIHWSLAGSKAICSSTASPRGVALGDFNRDGHPDAAVTCADGGIEVHFGDGDGNLRPGSPLRADMLADAILATDLNADGIVDLAVACRS